MTETTHPLPVAPAPAGALGRFLRVAPAHERVRGWQVGPAVDMAAYHFSWAFMLAPLLLLGDSHPMDYAPLLALTLTLSFVHRHVTLPGVYLDREVFRRHPIRFTVVPALLVVALLVSPALIAGGIPAGVVTLAGRSWPALAVSGSAVIGAVLLVAGAWNIWHVHMQKYGILRLYDAKCAGEPVPAWVDRLLVLGWLPLITSHLAIRYADLALERFSAARSYLAPLVSGAGAWQDVLMPLSACLASASVVVFFTTEWRRHRWRSAPRLSMGIGMIALSASFLFLNPIKVYIAFGFGHAVEYLVFVWAYQRRRYREPGPARPLLGRILARSALVFPGFALALAALYVFTKSWAHYGLELGSLPTWVIAGTQLTVWMRLWAVYQSLLHFYYDGFLWKARDPEFRDSI